MDLGGSARHAGDVLVVVALAIVYVVGLTVQTLLSYLVQAAESITPSPANGTEEHTLRR